jgi:hypothetical protein
MMPSRFYIKTWDGYLYCDGVLRGRRVIILASPFAYKYFNWEISFLSVSVYYTLSVMAIWLLKRGNCCLPLWTFGLSYFRAVVALWRLVNGEMRYSATTFLSSFMGGTMHNPLIRFKFYRLDCSQGDSQLFSRYPNSNHSIWLLQ